MQSSELNVRIEEMKVEIHKVHDIDDESNELWIFLRVKEEAFVAS